MISQGDETNQIFANPDGTLTAEMRAVPNRVRRGTGWTPLDTKLRFAADGTVVPGATVTPLVLSGGGGAPLVRASKGTHSLSLGWNGSLPKPTLSGSTATYSNVLPDVDLTVTATPTGYTHALVVKTPAAAKNPALATVKYPISASSGLSVATNNDGGYTVSDSTGKPVFSAGTPAMWDSPTPAVAPAPGPAMKGLAAAGAAGAPNGVAAVDVPDEGEHRAVMPLSVDAGQMQLTPVQEILTDPTARFPITIDPGVATHWAYQWNRTQKESPNYNYFGRQGSYATVGYDGWGFSGTYRSVFQMNIPSAARGGTIIRDSANWSYFKITLYHSGACTDAMTSLFPTSNNVAGAVWSNTDWPYTLATAVGHANKAGGCGNGSDQPNQDLYFQAQGLDNYFQQAVNSPDGTFGLGLAAPSEGDKYQWMKYLPDTALVSFRYNHAPTVSGQQIVAFPGCGTVGSPTYLDTGKPQMTATLNDVDSGDVLRANLIIQKAGQTVYSVDSPNRTGTGAVTWPAVSPELTEGTYTYRMTAFDGTNWGPVSGDCVFTVATAAPVKAPTITFDNNEFLDFGPPVTAVMTLTFSPNGETGVASYRYGLDDPNNLPNTVKANAAGNATVAVTITNSNMHKIYVQSLNAAGKPNTDGPSNKDLQFVYPAPTPNPGNILANPGAELQTNAGWIVANGSSVTVVNDDTAAHGGSFFRLNAGTATSGSIYQDIVSTWNAQTGTGINASAGQCYEGSAWVRSATGGPYTGKLAISALGGATANQREMFTFTAQPDQWTRVIAPLCVYATDRNALRLQVYESSVGDLDVDLLSMVNVGLTSASFEYGHAEGWNTFGTTTKTVKADATAQQGGSYLQANSTSNNSVYQDLAGKYPAGTLLLASTWVRSANGSTYPGDLTLWMNPGTGQTTVTTHFIAQPGAWTQVFLPYYVNETGRTVARFEIYLRTAGNLDIDGTELRPITAYPGTSGPAVARTTNYQLVNKNSNKCATVEATSTNNGAKILQSDCNATAQNQIFRLEQVSDNSYYRIKALYDSKCVTAQAPGDNYQVLVQWDCVNGYATQHFMPTGGDGVTNPVELHPFSNPGSCADVFNWSTANDAEIKQWDCRNGELQPHANQQFFLRALP
ncbi:RICIN domain-containing protein [Longispora fulva]|uniref:Ricin B lectin domain-containing protein n=1 Tax=Longispora fulva TaxID=619741 RepID=A0A8J7GGT9_9ACTN|nr:RICIN domain-containing protein [Longispora fulva]MBG6136462.1 hypothetical protein [Longispora fulva]